MTRSSLRLVAVVAASCGVARADVYDAARDFSPTADPSGVWSYGYSTTPGGTFIPYTDHGDFPSLNGSPTGLDAWWKDISLHDPAVIHNGTGSPITLNGTTTFAPGQLGLHPGPDGEDSILRFTAPGAGTYSLASSFTGIDTNGTTTDVHVLLDGGSLLDGLINGFGTGPVFSRALNLAAGDHLDFVVGYGANKNFLSDSTGVSAILTTAAVPEPCSMALLGVGFLAAIWRSRRR